MIRRMMGTAAATAATRTTNCKKGSYHETFFYLEYIRVYSIKQK